MVKNYYSEILKSIFEKIKQNSIINLQILIDWKRLGTTDQKKSLEKFTLSSVNLTYSKKIWVKLLIFTRRRLLEVKLITSSRDYKITEVYPYYYY